MPLIERWRERRLHHRAWDLASTLHDYLDQEPAIAGFTAAEVRRARGRLATILDDDQALDDFTTSLRQRHAASLASQPTSTTAPAAADFASWLRWALGVLVEAVRFIVEHPALIKFLLALLLAVVDQRHAVCPLPA